MLRANTMLEIVKTHGTEHMVYKYDTPLCKIKDFTLRALNVETLAGIEKF